jgi:hypothetical protein
MHKQSKISAHLNKWLFSNGSDLMQFKKILGLEIQTILNAQIWPKT